MPPRPQAGDLVKLRGPYFDNAVGVVIRSIYSWSTMSDAFVVRVNDEVTHHAPRERITILSKA
jgi:hypothetical protein